jgi:hypothetical protein
MTSRLTNGINPGDRLDTDDFNPRNTNNSPSVLNTYIDKRQVHFHCYNDGTPSPDPEVSPYTPAITTINGINYRLVPDPDRPPLIPFTTYTKALPRFYYALDTGEHVVCWRHEVKNKYEIISPSMLLGMDIVLKIPHFIQRYFDEIFTIFATFVIAVRIVR